MLQISGTYTDLYQLIMAQVYFLNHNNQKAVFDYFFRKLPFKNGYAIFSGLESLLEALEHFQFTTQDLDYLQQQGFDSSFINYLKDFKFKGAIYSVQEGELVFPTQPVLQVKASLIEAQLIETILLNYLNFQTLIATKASRIRQVAPQSTLIDFGMRRAQAMGAYFASRAAFIGGFDATSNVKAAADFKIPVAGTMAHAFVQSYNTELEAFQAYAKAHPKNCILLIDTYDCLKSGLPNAIKIAKSLQQQGYQLQGIRIDSGDLAYLSQQCRQQLDAEGLTDVKIAVSNQLDEYVIKSLQEQNAPIDVYGVGTNLVIGHPDAALDGVYKLAYANQKPRLKLSENIAKSTLPHQKQVYRLRDQNQQLIGANIIAKAEEQPDFNKMHHPFDLTKTMPLDQLKFEALLQPVMLNGKRQQAPTPLVDIKRFAEQQLAELPAEYKRFTNPHLYKVGLSTALLEAREKLRTTYKS